MARTKKSTRKFEQNHLKDVLEKRKEGAKLKQRNQAKDKKRAKRDKQNAEDFQDGHAESEKPSGQKPVEKNGFKDMTVDEFFQGGFDIPEPAKMKRKKGVEAKENPRKRKIVALEEDSGDSDTSADSLDPTSVPSEDDSDSSDNADVDDHMAELDKLAERDPEFYKHLKDTDPELLDFSNFAEVDGLSGSDTEAIASKKTKTKTKKKSKEDTSAGVDEDEKIQESSVDDSEITMATVRKWTAALIEKHSLRAMRQVVLAFRAAAYVNDDGGKQYRYTISSPEIYHEILVLTLKHVPGVLLHHLPVNELPSGKVRVSTDSKKFRTLTPLLKSHASSIEHLLTSLSDDVTMKVALSSILPLLPYLLPFKKVLRNLLRTLVSIWSDPSPSEAVRITSFLVVRRLAVIADDGIREAVLKTVYQGLIKGARNTTSHSLPGVNLMKNSAAELWGLDQKGGYTTGFAFIRQLAIHLRGSITNPAKDSYKTVYNWQYVHSLDFWSRVLCAHCDSLTEATSGRSSPLRPLIYPVVQITLGAMRLIPTSQYFPLRFHLTRSLLRLSRATGTYIPLAPALLEVLTSAEMKKVPKPSTLKGLDFAISLRAPKTYLRTRIYQDGIGEQVTELLGECFALWTKSIAFPELALPVVVMLKRWLRELTNKASGNKNSKVTAAIGVLVSKLEMNSRWIEERRAKVDFAPDDRAGVEAFLKEVQWENTPLGAYMFGQRKGREERERVLEEARREQNGTRVSRNGGVEDVALSDDEQMLDE